MRKVVTIPESISVTITLPDGPQTKLFAFTDFLRGRLNDQVWGRSLELMEARSELSTLFGTATPGSEVSLRRSDWDALAACCRSPSSPYFPEMMGQAMAFIYAITDAKDEASE